MQAIALSLVLGYQLNPGVTRDYDLTVAFDGMIPILGGQEGKAVVNLGFRLEGMKPTKDKEQKAFSELTRAEFIFNGSKLPLGLENVQDFFPKTTIELLADGTIQSSDAPKKDLPIKLPGLDIQRFPDISYLPVIFPKQAIEVGNSWSFEKPFGGSNMKYVCTFSKLEKEKAMISIRIDQSYVVLEDSAMQVVTDKADASNEVTTRMTALGEVKFDTKLGLVDSYSMDGFSDSDVKSIETNEVTKRKLKLSVKLSEAKSPKIGTRK